MNQFKTADHFAAELGFKGAKFAWQSGPQGEECLGQWWRFVHSNIHINADVVYALMQYCDATDSNVEIAACVKGKEVVLASGKTIRVQ